jgi:hypothetical protein
VSGIDAYDSVLADAQQRLDAGRITPKGLELVQERVAAGREAQQTGVETPYTPDSVAQALERVTKPDDGPEVPSEGNPETEAGYMTEAAHDAAKVILGKFMVGDRVRVGSSMGIVVGLAGDYVRVHPDSAKNPKAYNRVPVRGVEFVSRPDNATTVSASKVEGQDAKFGEEAGQLNADMAGLVQLLGANMYASNVADVSVKELLQNAFDAVKGAVSGRKAPSLYKGGKIEIMLDSDERTITLKDNARGMTPEIVREAFFTVAGSDKSDLDPQDRSGGLGLAKMGFMMGADWLKLDTVRDGVRVTVDATSKEIASSNFKIKKSPAPAGEHGTTVTVKVPETYTDPKTGEAKNIWFPYGKDAVDILNKPLIGPVEVEFTFNKYGTPVTETLPMGTNFPYDNYRKLEAKFDWGTADIYYGTERKKYPDHQVLSSGVYQFNQRFKLNQNDDIPFDIIVNIKSDVEAKHPDYPFENSRERFKGRLKADIDALSGYLTKIARGVEAADLKETMQNVVSLPRVEVGEEVKGLEGKLKKSFGAEATGPARELPQLPTQVRVTDLGVVDGGGRVVWDRTKEDEKKKQSSFESKEAAPTQDDFMIELDQDPKNPIFHNNTNFDPIAVGTPYGNPAKFFAELGSIFVEMKELMASSGLWGYDKLSPENFFYAGIGIDKQYGGLHTRVPYKSVLVNPFYDQFGARTLNGMQAQILDTMIHEIAHIQEMKHNEHHNSAMLRTKLHLADEGMLDYFSDNIMNTLLQHESAYAAMREAYGRSTTQNIAKSLEDYGKSGNASREVGAAPSGRPDASGAVPAGREQGGGSDIQVSASASPKGPKSGGVGGAGKQPVNNATVNKVAAAKLTKAQIKRLEEAAGVRRMKITGMQKRILRSRSAEETTSLMGKLMLIARNPSQDGNILTSLFNSISTPSLFQKLLGPQMTEDVVRIANALGLKNAQRIDDLMRNEYIPYVNRMILSASQTSDKLADFLSRTELGGQALTDAIIYANMVDVDPALAPNATEYMRIDGKLQELNSELANEIDPKKQDALKKDISDRRGEIFRAYTGGVDEQTGETVYGWNDLSRPEFGGGAGKLMFRMLRDEYRKSFNEHYRLLMARIDASDLKSEDAIRIKDTIEKLFAEAKKRTIYFPLKRFGDYWVSVGKGKTGEFHMFESATAQEAFMAQLRADKDTRNYSSGFGRDSLIKELTRNDASAALKGVLDLIASGKASDVDVLEESVLQLYLTALPESDMRRRFIHRNFKTGFSTDLLRTFASTSIASANQLGRLAYNYKFDNLIKAGFKETEGRPSKAKLDTITREMALRVKGLLSPDPQNDLDWWLSVGAKATFYQLLSAPKSAITNFLQLHVVGLNALSAEFGEAATATMAARYTRTSLTGKRFGNPFMDKDGNLKLQMPVFTLEDSPYIKEMRKSDPERYGETLKAWRFFEMRDVTQSTFAASADIYERSNKPSDTYSMSQAINRGDSVSAGRRAIANVGQFMGSFFHGTERIGREIMAMSAFDMAYERAIKQGKSSKDAGKEARELAEKLTNKAMFDFSNWNKSRYAKSRGGRLALQMRSYSQSMTSLLLRSFFSMLPLFNKEGKLAAARMFFGVGTMTMLLGGMRAPQFYMMALGAYGIYEFVKETFGGDDEDEEVEGGYISEETLNREMLKYADEKGRELSKKDMDYFIRSVWIPETFGPGGTVANALNLSEEAAAKLADMVDMGLPALFGVDISSSVSLTDLWHSTPAKSDDPEAMFLETMGRMIFGPSAALLAVPFRVYKEAEAGNIDKAFEAAMPAILKNPLKAMRLSEEGLVVGKNRDVVLKDPSFYDVFTLAMQSAGFSEATTSREMQLDIMAGDIEEEVGAQATKLLDKRYRAVMEFNKNPTDENLKDWKRVERDIAVYNLNYPSNQITDEDKDKSFQSKSDVAGERAYGLGYNPKIPVRQPLAEQRAANMAKGE